MNMSYFENLVDQKLLSVSTVYLARVLSHTANASTCKLQPLSLTKAVGGVAKKQAVLTNVPISQSVLGALGTGRTLEGVVAIVASCERDTNQTRKNVFALPSIRHHSKSDSVVIGCLTENKNTGGSSGGESSHAHDNLYVLDGITAADVTAWDETVEAVGELKKLDHVGQFWRDAEGNIKGEIFSDYENNVASGEFSTAIGHKTTASGDGALAAGYYSAANGHTAIAIGHAAKATEMYSTAIGQYATAEKQYSIAIGSDVTASDYFATAIGNNTVASGRCSVAIGEETTASAWYATAIGYQVTASAMYATALGYQTTANSRATAMGCYTVANGADSTAMGCGTTASGKCSTVIGSFNVEDTANNYLFIVGNGSAYNNSNALTLTWDGTLWTAADVTATNSDSETVSLCETAKIASANADAISSNAAAIAENAALTASTLGTYRKNLFCPNNISEKTSVGVTHSCADGVFSASGTTTGSFTAYLLKTSVSADRDIIISGASTLTNLTYMAKIVDASGTTSYKSIGTAGLTVEKGSTITSVYVQQRTSGKAVKADIELMMRYADITDSTFEPYADDVQTQIDALLARVAELETQVSLLSGSGGSN